MGVILEPKGVRLFAGIMFNGPEALKLGINDLEAKFGAVYKKSPIFDFNFTDYYEDEMGSGLKKTFVGFEKLVDPERLANIKLFTNQLEEKHGDVENGLLRRRINIDPGYVSKSNVVMASTKNSSQRLYLKDGIFAEVTLIFGGERFETLPWTYPDFKTQLAFNFFSYIRVNEKTC
jgi:hypothetical protein